MPTYTNLSILQGWLEIESVTSIQNNRMATPVLAGWIYTTDQEGVEDVFDERHPILITGKAAEAVLEMTRKISQKCPSFPSLGLIHLPISGEQSAGMLVSQGRPFVIVQGKLLSRDGQSRLDIKHISFLGAPWGALERLEEQSFAKHMQG